MCDGVPPRLFWRVWGSVDFAHLILITILGWKLVEGCENLAADQGSCGIRSMWEGRGMWSRGLAWPQEVRAVAGLLRQHVVRIYLV